MQALLIPESIWFLEFVRTARQQLSSTRHWPGVRKKGEGEIDREALSWASGYHELNSGNFSARSEPSSLLYDDKLLLHDKPLLYNKPILYVNSDMYGASDKPFAISRDFDAHR